jgi:hypothetical protein
MIRDSIDKHFSGRAFRLSANCDTIEDLFDALLP